jgi:hypothetical protein
MAKINLSDNWGHPVVFLFLIEQATHLERLREQLEDESSFELYLCVLPTVRELRRRIQQIDEAFAAAWTERNPVETDCARLQDRLTRLLQSLIHIPDSHPETIQQLRDDHLTGCCYRLEYFEEKLRKLAEACLNSGSN